MPLDEDERLDELRRAEGEAILRHFVEQRERRDEELRRLLAAAIESKEADDDDE